MQKPVELMLPSEELHHAYRVIFTSPHGAMVLEDLKQAHHINGPTFNAQTRDVNEMLMAEGGRNVVLRILSIVNGESKDFKMSNAQE